MQIYHCFSFHDGKTQFVFTPLIHDLSPSGVWLYIHVCLVVFLNYVPWFQQKGNKGRSMIHQLRVPVKELKLADRIG